MEFDFNFFYVLFSCWWEKIKLFSVCFPVIFSSHCIYAQGLENIGFKIHFQKNWICGLFNCDSSSLQEITVCNRIILDTTEFYLVLYMYVHVRVYVLLVGGVCVINITCNMLYLFPIFWGFSILRHLYYNKSIYESGVVNKGWHMLLEKYLATYQHKRRKIKCLDYPIYLGCILFSALY